MFLYQLEQTGKVNREPRFSSYHLLNIWIAHFLDENHARQIFEVGATYQQFGIKFAGRRIHHRSQATVITIQNAVHFLSPSISTVKSAEEPGEIAASAIASWDSRLCTLLPLCLGNAGFCLHICIKNSRICPGDLNNYCAIVTIICRST